MFDSRYGAVLSDFDLEIWRYAEQGLGPLEFGRLTVRPCQNSTRRNPRDLNPAGCHEPDCGPEGCRQSKALIEPRTLAGTNGAAPAPRPRSLDNAK